MYLFGSFIFVQSRHINNEYTLSVKIKDKTETSIFPPIKI